MRSRDNKMEDGKMKLAAMLLLWLLGLIALVIMVYIFKNISWGGATEEILSQYFFVCCLLFISALLFWAGKKFYNMWQFDVQVNEVIREFDACEGGEEFEIRCETQAVADQFRRQRKSRIVYWFPYQSNHKKVMGVKSPERCE